MSTHDLTLRAVDPGDHEAIWPMLRDTVRAGTTYAIDPDISRQGLLELWCVAPRVTFLAEQGSVVLGTYFIKTNQRGGGAHVCNCGFVTAPEARGRGVARAMCEHAQSTARDLGYLAMQFNFVLESNAGAVALWSGMGFDTVGRLPRAFRHPDKGLVDALVMYKWLGE